MNRRKFIQASALAAGALSAPTIIPASAVGRTARRVAANERVTLGFIGTGNMGMGLLNRFLEDERVQVVALADVNEESDGYWNGGVAGREPARRRVSEAYGEQVRSGKYQPVDAYSDFREVIRREDVDAVVMALPDHWHALPVVMAANAGKDIYGEKPLSLTVADGRAMSDAVHANRRIFQTGSQQRSDARFRHAAELVRNNRIGELKTIRIGLPGGHPDFSKKAHLTDPQPVPAGFDYDMWLGPAPEAPYSPARTHVNFRWILDYSGGQVTDWGGHHPDIAQWAMGTAYTGPREIRNARGVFPTDGLYNTATEFYFEAVYDNGVTMIISNEEKMGIRFEGTEGWLWVTRGDHEVSDQKIWDSEIGNGDVHLVRSDNHYRNFIDGVLTRHEPVAPIEQAHRTITIAHLGNIAMRLGRDLKWDPDAEKVVGDAEANAMLSRPYRAPWKL